MSSVSRQPSFAILLSLAWLAAAVQLVLIYWSMTGDVLLDTDDALRLVQVRELIAGRGWFDLHETRLQPPLGYDSHWSRLIDAGLAGLLWLFQPFVDGAMAERLMRTVWPMLWLFPAMAGVAAIAWRLGGREAALVALVLVVIGLPALQHFKPGSIDHHNVQITLAVLAVAATVWCDRFAWTAWVAGGVTGLALAIGLETLPYLVVCGAALALRYVIDREAGEALRAYGGALAGMTALSFLVSVGPDHWGRSQCDAIAVNLAVPVIAGGLLLFGATRIAPDAGPWSRCGVIAGIAALMLALFVAIEPRCLGGPYAMVDPAIRPIWLDHVAETQPILEFIRYVPVKAAAIMAFPLAALLSAIVLAGDARVRDFAYFAATIVFAVAFVMTLGTIRANEYAMWLGMPLVALAALRLFTALKLSTLSARLVATLLLTPTVMSAGAIGLAHAAGLQATAVSRLEEIACFKMENYRTLARLPHGLIAAEVDFGPFLLALTPHSVLSAPYHRLSVGITAAQQVFVATPEESHALLRRLHVAYLVTCGSRAPLGITDAQRDASLWQRLQTGALPDWLEAVPETEGQPLRAFRVKS